MMDKMRVFTYSSDEILQHGIEALVRCQHELVAVDASAVDTADVAIIAGDLVDDALTTAIMAIQRDGCPRVLVVTSHLDTAGVLAGVEAGASAFLRRAEVTGTILARTVRSVVDGEGSVPAELLGDVLRHISRTHVQGLAPKGIHLTGLSDREVAVLRLVAQGLDTAAIATHLAYSERTVKGVIHDVTTRLQLRNRAHAVAYAMRAGLI